MGDSLTTIVAIIAAVALMCIFPLMAVSERSDDISQLSVQNITVDYVDTIRSTGRLSYEDYLKFVESISSTGNSYDVEIIVKIMNENVGKKLVQADMEKIGENIYYVMYTTQVMDKIQSDSANPRGKTLLLHEGDIVSVNVKNTNNTVAQLLRDAFYKVTGSDTYQVSASHGGIVTVNGK